MKETELAKRIKKLKNDNHMTNETLAEMAGLPLSNISKLLAGISKYPTVDTVAKIAAALNVSMDYLVYGENVPLNRTRSKEEYQLLDKYRNLNETGRFEMQKYADLLAQSPLYKKDTIPGVLEQKSS